MTILHRTILSTNMITFIHKDNHITVTDTIHSISSDTSLDSGVTIGLRGHHWTQGSP